jgi:hypothetical protein
VTYYLVRIIDPVDGQERPEETSDWIARALAVGFHAEVGVKPWMVDLDRPYIIDDPKSWHRFNSKGNPIIPEEAEVVVDGVGEDGSPIAPEEQADV